MARENFSIFANDYFDRLSRTLYSLDLDPLECLATDLELAWKNSKQVFLFGNGGSAGNAVHLANDFIYGISKSLGNALKIHALTANTSIITCLANDEGYDKIFSGQLATLASSGDIAIAFSGSGNSPNILSALEYCKSNQIKSYAFLGYDGGKAKALCDVPIHAGVSDMQISEDAQLILGHILMQWMYSRRNLIC